MILKSIIYKEHENDPKEWILEEFTLNKINLIVGKNAGGKSRTLNVISGLARLMIEQKMSTGNGYYLVKFDNGVGEISYELKIKNKAITKEVLTINDEVYLNRGMHGKGELRNVLVQKMLAFKIPKDELAITRRDEIQYPFLEKLYIWGSELRHFLFNTQLGKGELAIVDSSLKPTDYNLKETDKVIKLFRRGKKEFDQKFVDNIINDFNSIGYDINDVRTDALISITIETSISKEVIGIVVQENDREGYTDQHAMSTGMFRALSIIIHFVYYTLKKISGTVLIDDIGEGLDFERSSGLIQLLTKKSDKNNIQLIMSTNDRFVMNNTPLEYWQIIKREGSTVYMFNKNNSQRTFSEFEFTGLTNFDFFSTDFFKEGFQEN